MNDNVAKILQKIYLVVLTAKTTDNMAVNFFQRRLPFYQKGTIFKDF